MRKRLRRRHEEAELNITAFLNLMVILIPFLLITAAFNRFSVLDLYLPPASSGQSKPSLELQLEVTIREDSIEVGDRNGGLIRRIAKKESGYNLAALNELLTEIKARFPKKRSVFILSEPDTSYEVMIQVMDAVRVTEIEDAGMMVQAELFPDISLGDAPPALRNKKSSAKGKAS
jgi:biopolymer transport protein ExbD